MKLPWRILILTEAVPASGTAVKVNGSADAWLAAADVGITAGKATLAPRSAADFEPAAVGAALGGNATPAAIDAVLHAPAFQAAESVYRGLAMLMPLAGDAVSVEVQGIRRASLAKDFREQVYDREVSAPDPLSLVVLDFDFTHKGPDLAAQRELGDMAGAMQVPMIAGAGAGFFDVRFFVQTAAFTELLPRLGTAAHAPWREFQATEPARWIGLTLNRFLLRSPWPGETCADSNPDSYLWGRGGWLVAAAVARSVKEHGHALAIAGGQGGRFDNMPTRDFPTLKNEMKPLSTESTITDQQMTELERVGFTPVVGPLGAGTLLLPMVLTLFRLRPGVLSVEATLAYQILAARLAHTCGRLLDSRPEETGAALAHFRTGLLAFLDGFAGDDPAKAVAVELREVDGTRYADVKVAPKIVLEGKNVEFAFGLPLA